jgi:hypothetical protein
MAIEDQVKVLEDEFKLIKSELRQTLVSVRDFLLDIKLPPPEEVLNPPQDMGRINEQSPAVSQPDLPSFPGNQGFEGGNNGNGRNDQSGGPSRDNIDQSQHRTPEPVSDPFANLDNSSQMPSVSEPEDSQGPELTDLPDFSQASDEAAEFEPEDTGITSGEMPGDEDDTDSETTDTEAKENAEMKVDERKPYGSPVNMLANLVRWIAVAKREIGPEQLAAFLDLYSFSGNLSPEMKDVIIHLAQTSSDSIVEVRDMDRNRLINDQINLYIQINSLNGQVPAELKENVRHLTDQLLQQSAYTNKANVWSQMLLELHGILSEGEAPMRQITDSIRAKKEAEKKAEEEAKAKAEAEQAAKAEEKQPVKKAARPAKLRLVLPSADGQDQELELGDLFISSEIASGGETGQDGPPK